MLVKNKRKMNGKLLGTAFVLFFALFVFSQNSEVNATSSLQMNFSGKIVTDNGLDISYDPPACVNSGVDSCHFQIKYYDNVTAGDLLGSEVFSNVELGDYRGYFNLKFGSGSFTAAEHGSIKDIFLNEPDVYIEVLFDPAGGVTPDFNFGTNVELELFLVSHTAPIERMAVGTAPYSISSRGALDEFQLKVKNSAIGTNKGLVYFDGGENFMKVYDGTDWRSLSYLLWEEDVTGDIFFTSGDVTIGSVISPSGFSVFGDSLFTGNMIVDSGDLTIDGRLKFEGGLIGGSGNLVHIDGDGYLIDGGASSIRFKRDVESYGSVLSALAELDLVNFTWNELSSSSGKEDVGMIAEEVAKYIPELVLYNSFGQVQGLKYDRMGAFAIAGLGELKNEFDEFRNTIKDDEVELTLYTSINDLDLGNLVVKDFSVDQGINLFENSNLPLYGIVSEIIYGDEEEITGYNVVPYEGFGKYDVLVSRGEESEEIFGSQVALGMNIAGQLEILDEEDVTTSVLGYTSGILEFEEDEYSKVVSVYLTYSPLVFGFNSLSLFTQDFEDSSRLSFGGGHINIRGHRGEFTFLKTGVLEVTGDILIHSEQGETVQVYPLLERISELEERLLELEGGVDQVGSE